MSNDDVGTALRQACENDADDDAYVLARPARIVRKMHQPSLVAPFQ